MALAAAAWGSRNNNQMLLLLCIRERWRHRWRMLSRSAILVVGRTEWRECCSRGTGPSTHQTTTPAHAHTRLLRFFLVSSGGHKCWMSYTSSRKIEEEEEEKSYAKRNGQRAIRWRPVDQQQFLLLFSGSFWPSLSSSSFLSSFDGIHFFRLCLHQPNQTKSIFGRFSFTAR